MSEARRLFVDCDDTLVLYQSTDTKNPYGVYMGTPWEPNVGLISAVKAVADDITVFVWSGGGRDYAKLWADRLFPGVDVIPLSKDKDLVRAEDIVIDDRLEFAVPCKVYQPDEVGWMNKFDW